MKKSILTNKFQDYLVAEDFAPGDNIPGEIELAERFGVSRGAMRETLQHFVQLGLLERIKKRGTVIKPFSSGETDRSLAFCLRMGGFSFEEMKEARTIFETAILPCIIQRMTPGMLEKLESNLAEQNENIGSVEKFEELDRRFHTLLFETCQNRVLNLFSNVLAIVFQEKHRKRFRNTQWTQIGYENHKRILEAIRSRDEKTLNKLIYEHIIPT